MDILLLAIQLEIIRILMLDIMEEVQETVLMVHQTKAHINRQALLAITIILSPSIIQVVIKHTTTFNHISQYTVGSGLTSRWGNAEPQSFSQHKYNRQP